MQTFVLSREQVKSPEAGTVDINAFVGDVWIVARATWSSSEHANFSNRQFACPALLSFHFDFDMSREHCDSSGNL
jgi:hypothetical protein